jgi:hypothetical protein
MIILGKNWCIKQRLESYHKVEGSVYVLRDYSDRIGIEMNNQAQSHGMSNRSSMGIEGCAVRYMKEAANEAELAREALMFFSFVAKDKRQDAKTSYTSTQGYSSRSSSSSTIY